MTSMILDPVPRSLDQSSVPQSSDGVWTRTLPDVRSWQILSNAPKATCPAPYSITFPARELAPKAELEQFVMDCQSGIISRSTVG